MRSDNVLTGNSGTNTLTGGAGNDTYVVGTGDSVVEGAVRVPIRCKARPPGRWPRMSRI